jgi:serine/threonine protein kinase/Tfp pilus assembly protein PilF
MEETAKSLAAGDRVLNYEILDLAGLGGMGIVYKALDTKLQRLVALKFLPPHLTSSDHDRKRLLHEARSASTLDHPNIGVIHAIEETPDGQTFIVMAFYEGTTLAHRISSSTISMMDAVDIAKQIAEGLAEAHKHSVIHRDIKPSNIILTREGVVKIVDFGLALLLRDSATRSLGMAGTAVYMAPEQTQGSPADQRSDMWALGVVLAEMLLGHHPFLRESWWATINAILNDPPDPLDGIPQDLQAIVFRALAKDPGRRYPSCQPMLADLKRVNSLVQKVEAGPTDSTLSSPFVTPEDLKRYAHNASGSFKTYDDRRKAVRRRLLAGVSAIAVVAALWFSALGPRIGSRFLHPQSEKAAYEAYLSAMGKIQRYDKTGNLDLAISELRSAVARDKQFALGYAGLGEAFRLKYRLDHDKKWLDDSLANCKTALELDSRLSAVYVTLGRIHNDAGNHDLAMSEFQHALDLDPRNADALIGVAHAQESAGQVAEAEATYKKAVALRPDSWDGYNTLGGFYYRQHRVEDAIAQLQQAAKLTPDNTQVYNNLAAFYLVSARPQDLVSAEQALKKSIEISPSYPAFANLGLLYMQQQRYAESAEITRRAVELNDKDFLAWENLDWAYRWIGQNAKAQAARDKAFELLEQAAQSRPRDAQVQSHLAFQYGMRGLRQQAITRVQAALALASDDPDVLVNVSNTYQVLGDHRQAMHYAQLSLQNGYTLADLRRDPDMQSVLSDPELQSQIAVKSH